MITPVLTDCHGESLILLPGADLMAFIPTSPQDHVNFTGSSHPYCSSIGTKPRFYGHQVSSLYKYGVPGQDLSNRYCHLDSLKQSSSNIQKPSSNILEHSNIFPQTSYSNIQIFASDILDKFKHFLVFHG